MEGCGRPGVRPGCRCSPSGMKLQGHKGAPAAQPPAIACYNPIPILLPFLPLASSHPRCPSLLCSDSHFLQLCSSPHSPMVLPPVLGVSRAKLTLFTGFSELSSSLGVGPETSSLLLLKTVFTSFHFCCDQFELTSAELLSSRACTALAEAG